MATLTRRDGIKFNFVGFTDGGVPDSGSFVMGDWCEITGGIGLCVEAGTPGRWVALTVAGTAPTVPATPVTFTQTYATADTTVPAVTYVAPAVTAATVATADGSDAATTQALANALKVELNKVIADNVAIRAAQAQLAADSLQNRKLVNKLIDVDQAASLAL